MPSDQKLCQLCGIDVANQKRIKDPHGLYYCQPCYLKLKNPAPQPAPVANDLFACADCKKLIPQKQITNDDGDFLCQPCFKKRRTPILPGQKPAKPLIDYERHKPGHNSAAEPFSHSLAGGSLIALIVLAATFLALSALNFFLLGAAAKPAHFIIIALTSGVETLFILILASLLIVSMFIAAKLVGGIDFGYLGVVLWKSILAILAIFIATTLLSFLHLPCFFGLGITLCLYATVCVIIFKIDYTHAFVLALVNIILWFFATIALLSLLPR